MVVGLVKKVTEALIGNHRQVLEHLDPQGPAAVKQAAALEMARKTVEAAGGFPEEPARIDGVRATHGDPTRPVDGVELRDPDRAVDVVGKPLMADGPAPIYQWEWVCEGKGLLHSSAWAWTSRRPADGWARDGGDGGFTLLETLVSLALMTVLMTALTPFFTGWLRTTSLQRDRQVAIQLAGDAMERVRALDPSGLLDGRSRAAVQGQWAQAPAALRSSYATAMLCDWDPVLSSEAAAACVSSAAADPTAAGAQASLPTVPVPVTVAGVTFQQNWYVGRCWQPTSAGAACTAASGTGYLPFVRVIVAVTWPDRKCSGGVCAYLSTTLVSAAADPVFNLWG